LFTSDGKLLEQKRNLALPEASEVVAAQAAMVGELMNLIEIDRGGELFYEIIARDGYLDRYYLLLDAPGNLLEKKKL
jgi:hypothetical protein